MIDSKLTPIYVVDCKWMDCLVVELAQGGLLQMWIHRLIFWGLFRLAKSVKQKVQKLNHNMPWTLRLTDWISVGAWQVTCDSWQKIFFCLFGFFGIGATIRTCKEIQWLPFFFTIAKDIRGFSSCFELLLVCRHVCSRQTPFTQGTDCVRDSKRTCQNN